MQKSHLAPTLKGLRDNLPQQSILGGLRFGDLVDHQTDATFGNNVRDAVANLDRDDGLRSINAKHREKVHDWIRAPADHCHNLRSADLAPNDWVWLTVRGSREANEEFIDDVQKEAHGNKPAAPTWSQVTADEQFTIVARDDHKGSEQSKGPRFGAVFFLWQVHDQENLN